MKPCLNYDAKKYSGKEKSPLGCGFSAHGDAVGKIRIGKDQQLYICTETRRGNIWRKFLFKNDEYPEKFFRPVWFPSFKKIDEETETGLEEKTGGLPFLINGEKWPETEDGEKFLFLGQFKDLRDEGDFLYRVFVDEMGDESWVSKIELTESNISKQIKFSTKSFTGYCITKWTETTELISFNEILHELNIEDKEEETLFYDKYYDDYCEYPKHPSCAIKLGGTSVFCQHVLNLDRHKNFIQLSTCTSLPFEWGDSGIAHIYANSKNKLYLDFDCY